MYKYTPFFPSNTVNISIYYISHPDIFTGRNFESECIVLDSLSSNLIECPIMNSPRLTDGVTGEGLSSLNTDQFVGWESQNHDTFTIAPEFDPHASPRLVMDIYFYNNPAMGIGLPPILDIFVGYNIPHGDVGPVRFTYANNQYLIESNNDTTMISVVFTITHFDGDNIETSYTVFWIRFDFSSTTLSRAFISEVKIFNETGKLKHICNSKLLLRVISRSMVVLLS